MMCALKSLRMKYRQASGRRHRRHDLTHAHTNTTTGPAVLPPPTRGHPNPSPPPHHKEIQRQRRRRPAASCSHQGGGRPRPPPARLVPGVGACGGGVGGVRAALQWLWQPWWWGWGGRRGLAVAAPAIVARAAAEVSQVGASGMTMCVYIRSRRPNKHTTNRTSIHQPATTPPPSSPRPWPPPGLCSGWWHRTPRCCYNRYIHLCYMLVCVRACMYIPSGLCLTHHTYTIYINQKQAGHGSLGPRPPRLLPPPPPPPTAPRPTVTGSREGGAAPLCVRRGAGRVGAGKHAVVITPTPVHDQHPSSILHYTNTHAPLNRPSGA